MNFLVGLAGRAGSGKSVIADELETMGLSRIRMSDPLKRMLRGLYQSAGLDHREIERRIEGDLKDVPDPLLDGKTPRYAMQTLGTEWGRDLISPRIWCALASIKIRRELQLGRSVVVEDIRMPEEMNVIHHFGGTISYVTRADLEDVAGDHPTEKLTSDMCDFEIPNAYDVENLRARTRHIFADACEVAA